MMPMMLIENGRQQHSTASAVESFRNEMVKSNERSQQILIETAKVAQITNDPKVIESE